MESDLIKPRRPWLAGLLSLTGAPIGQLYAGYPIRAIVLAILFFALPFATYLVLRFPLNPMAAIAIVLTALSAQLFLPAVDAFILARHSRPKQLQSYQRWWVYLLVFIAATFIGVVNSYLLRSYITEAFIVPSGSMFPTVQHYDRILVDKFLFDASELKRNDLAVYSSSGPNPQLYIKRVIAMPGETVEIREEQLLINGKRVPDRFATIDTDQTLIPELTNYGPATVPPDSYFVLGDNRRNSLDSRMEGPVSADRFQGVARMIYWSNDYTFTDNTQRPWQQPQAIKGKFRWDRIGKRLD